MSEGEFSAFYSGGVKRKGFINSVAFKSYVAIIRLYGFFIGLVYGFW